MDDIIMMCQKQVYSQRKMLEEGLVLEEIGGSRGLSRIIREFMDKFWALQNN